MPETRLRTLRNPIVVMAFGGWSDAAQAATDAVEHLVTSYRSDTVLALEPGEYYDFQSSRPLAQLDADGDRIISWPTTEVILTRLPQRDLVIVRGPEPNFRWPAYVSTLVAAMSLAKPELVVVLGALLSENPHSRPVPVSLSSSNASLREQYDAEKPTYEGPTGIQGVMAHACHVAELPTLSLWASCPHYVANPPNPKATLALLTRLEDFIGPIDLGDLPARAELWEKNVDELADDDPDVAEYIHNLEVANDSGQSEPSGDAIAAEFQRYLRRRDET